MASTIYYPPIVKDYEPAFIAGSENGVRIHFNLSSLSGNMPSGWTVHASIIRNDGVLVVDTVDSDTQTGINIYRYRATGTILNLYPTNEGNNNYYITLLNEDLKTTATIGGVDYDGFIPGTTYKVQLRLSTVSCPSSRQLEQEAWLQENSSNFTEWSTICFIKAISEMTVRNNQGFTTATSYDNKTVTEISGNIYNDDIDEDYYSCNIKLYQCDSNGNRGNLLEDSGNIYNEDIKRTYYSYIFKTRFVASNKYQIVLNYITENDYQSNDIIYRFTYSEAGTGSSNYGVTTIEMPEGTRMGGRTSVSQEEDEGRVALKLYYSSGNLPNKGSVYIRRASSKDNFTTWEDVMFIKVYNAQNPETSPNANDINNSAIFYDYTIESGVWYKYAVQPYNEQNGVRMVTNYMNTPIVRIFNFSYLLGFGEQQLKLEFDNGISNYNIKVAEGQQETIGSKYPYLNRNNKVYYHNFGLSGLISFNMDEQNTFLKEGKKSIYKYDDVVNLYNNYNINNCITQYDYTFERDFRNKVYEFLYAGKPFVFKSPTEGNLIVRLKDVGCTPNQSLSRLVYSFNANVLEIDDNTLNNYKKYGLFEFNKKIPNSMNEDVSYHTHTLNSETPTFLWNT